MTSLSVQSNKYFSKFLYNFRSDKVQLPAGGYWYDTTLTAPTAGYYWCTKRHPFPAAYNMYFNSSNTNISTSGGMGADDRYYGQPICPVQ